MISDADQHNELSWRTYHSGGRPIDKIRFWLHHVLFWWVFKNLAVYIQSIQCKFFTMASYFETGAPSDKKKRCWSAERIKLRHTTQAVALSTRLFFGLFMFCFYEFSITLLFGSKAYNLNWFTLLDLIWYRKTSWIMISDANLQNELSWRTYHSTVALSSIFVFGFIMCCFDEFSKPRLFGSKTYNLELFILLDLLWDRSAFLYDDKRC